MNLLESKFKESDKNNVIVRFEPLLDGKIEIIEIIELFYMKLYKDMEDKQKMLYKKYIEKIVKSLGVLSFTGTKLSVPLPFIEFGAHVELDFDKKYEELFKIWAEDGNNSFTELTDDLNKQLQKNDLRIIILIDEMDRLPCENIVNILCKRLKKGS